MCTLLRGCAVFYDSIGAGGLWACSVLGLANTVKVAVQPDGQVVAGSCRCTGCWGKGEAGVMWCRRI